MMEKLDIPLLIHGEVNDPNIDIFDREKIFIEKNLINAHKEFPDLRIVLEHISTKESTEFVKDQVIILRQQLHRNTFFIIETSYFQEV